jgi:hypothetical protein
MSDMYLLRAGKVELIGPKSEYRLSGGSPENLRCGAEAAELVERDEPSRLNRRPRLRP